MKMDTRTPGKYLELKVAAKNLRFVDWTDKIEHEISENVSMLKGSITALEADLQVAAQCAGRKASRSPLQTWDTIR